jgi:CDP-diacylglycerol--glycerol-3-phosphate 3-phosphatidyltransferase
MPLLPPEGQWSLIVLVTVGTSAFVSMAVYALLGRRHDPDAEGKGRQLFLGTGDFLLHWFMWAVGPVVWISLKLGLTPDFYNFAGLFLGLASGIYIALDDLTLGGWAIALGGLCDILDGRIARLTGVASPYGDFVDSSFDRFVEVFAFLGFVVFFRHHQYGPFLAAAAMAGSLLVSYARARGEVQGVDCSSGLMQRGERLVLTCLVCLIDPPLMTYLGEPVGTVALWMLGVMAVATFGTAVYRTVWIALRLRLAPGASPR